MIEFNHVALKYPYDEYAVLKDLSFTLVDGVNTILCDTQSGKSSICKLLTKQFNPTDGRIVVDNNDIISITNEGLGILYMPAKPTFFENRSVEYNVLYPLKVRKVLKSLQTELFNKITMQIGLSKVDVKLKKLSENERKKVALARGLTVKRKTVLLDDFCENNEQIENIINLFDGATIVILTSNVSLSRGNVVVLDGGVSVYQGNVDGAIECKSKLDWIVDMLRSE